MKYETALQYAEEIKGILAPYCERIEIAGGIRRKKTEPHDIEIVAQPKIFTLQDYSLGFGNIEFNRLDNEIKRRLACDFPRFEKGDPDKAGKKAPCGPKYYRLKYRGEKLDIFSVIPPAQWGTVFLIRTGDADFSHEYVTRLWTYSLRSVDGHIENSKGEVVDTPSEEDCFKLIHSEYIEPERRTAQALRRFCCDRWTSSKIFSLLHGWTWLGSAKRGVSL